MLSDIIVAGQIVEIGAVKEADDNPEDGIQEMKKTYRTKVFDVLSEDQLEIMMPIEKGKVILLAVDGQFDLCFYTEKGLYQCFARVLDRYKSNNIYIVVVELTSNLRKRQRREYYRLDCALGVMVRRLEDTEIAALEQNQFRPKEGLPMKKGAIADISGGGLRFIADYGFDVGTMIYCTYILNMKNGEKQYHMAGRVLRSEELEDRPGIYENRVQYINMDVDEREEIIRYIFEEERRQRHKAINK